MRVLVVLVCMLCAMGCASASVVVYSSGHGRDYVDACGYIDREGRIAITPVYGAAGRFSEGFAPVLDAKGKWGYIDRIGRWAISPVFDHAESFADGLGLVEADMRWYFIDHKGRPTVPLLRQAPWSPKAQGTWSGWWMASSFGDGLAAVAVLPALPAGADFEARLMLVDRTGKPVTGSVFYGVSGFSEGLSGATMRVGERGEFERPKTNDWGYIDRTGNWVIAPRFVEARRFSEGLAYVVLRRSNDTVDYGYIDSSGNLAFTRTRPSMRYGVNIVQEGDFDFHEGLAVLYNGQKFGYCDKTGREVASPRHGLAEPFFEGLALVKDQDPIGTYYTPGTYRYIDHAGKTVIRRPDMVDGGRFSEGLAPVVIRYARPKRSVLIDRSGKPTTRRRFDEVGAMSEGRAPVRFGSEESARWGFIDRTGKVVITPKFSGVSGFHEGLASVRVGSLTNGKWGFVDRFGRMTIPAIYTWTCDFSQGLASVTLAVADRTSGKTRYRDGYVNRAGRLVIGPKYDWAGRFSEGLAPVAPRRATAEGRSIESDRVYRYGFIDRHGSMVIPPILESPLYDDPDGLHDSLARVRVNGRYGFIDRTGRIVIKPQYEETGQFSQGLAWVRVTIETPSDPHESAPRPARRKVDRYGYIDRTGKVVIPVRFEFAGDFHEGCAPVRFPTDGPKLWGLIDRRGRTLFRREGEGISGLADGLIRFDFRYQGDTEPSTYPWSGYLDRRGRVIIRPGFDVAGDFHEGVAPVFFDGIPARPPTR